jgi:hypothetical protein
MCEPRRARGRAGVTAAVVTALAVLAAGPVLRVVSVLGLVLVVMGLVLASVCMALVVFLLVRFRRAPAYPVRPVLRVRVVPQAGPRKAIGDASRGGEGAVGGEERVRSWL